MLKTGWVYTLKKDELILLLQEMDLDTSGTVEELRKRFAKFISADHDTTVTSRLLASQQSYEAPNAMTTSTEKRDATEGIPRGDHLGPQIMATRETSPTGQLKPNLLEDIRKWGLSYDGNPNPFPFLERLEELAEVYQIELDHLPRLMPEFLRTRALIWFRNNNQYWQEWD